MACVVVLCVILLLSQVEMLPVSQTDPSFNVGQESQSTVEVTPAVYRVKRTVIGYGRCADGMVKLYVNGPCVTCEMYMEHKDTDDCPNNG